RLLTPAVSGRPSRTEDLMPSFHRLCVAAAFAGSVVTSLLAFGAVFGGPALSAQAPAGEVDTHINAARTAAGLDYRATFVNLCFSGANPGLANPAVARAGGAAAPGARGAADGRGAAAPARGAADGRGGGRGPGATPDRATWYASPYKVFDNFYWLGTRQHSSWALRT